MISNASSLIIFGKLNKLEFLYELFGKLVISQAVYEEVVENWMKINAPEAMLIKNQIESGKIIIKKLNQEFQKKAKLLENIYASLDYGESETIALALEMNEKDVLIDERVARNVAKLEGLTPKGSLYVLLIAFKKKKLTEKEIKFLVTEMTATKFRLSSEVSNKFWQMFDELN